MTRQIDHIVIYVEDLEQGITDYTALGFTVVRGGEHPGGATHNALVVFEDGAYFELISFLRPAEGFIWWQKATGAGEGLLDYALLPTDIGRDIAAARSRGLDIAGPTPGGRLRPDGVQVDWQIGRASTPDLPFYCYDVTPRSLRVPEGAVRSHANGATGVSGITVVVSNLERSAEHYRQLLGDAAHEEAALTGEQGGVRSARFRLGGAVITLLQPIAGGGPEADSLSSYLQARGDGPYAVRLLTNNESAAGSRDAGLTHGVRLVLLVAEPVGAAS